MNRRRPTVKDVAALAGVSPKTVSNVLTGAASVTAQTRERVEAAMRELDYVPNYSARTLRNGRSGVIALALPDLTTSFSANLIHHFVQEAHERGLAVQIEETAKDPAREYELLSRARAHQIDGLVLNPATLADSAVEHSDALPPVVLIGEVQQQRADQVCIDSVAAARDATRHLIGRGARRIGVIGAPSVTFDTATAHTRFEGYRAAIAEAGLTFEPALSGSAAEWSPIGGRRAAEQVLDRARPDALFCFTDSLALGAISALWALGLRVPDDVLVCGFDDIPDAAAATPPLSTIRLPLRAYAATALDLLENRLVNRNSPPRRRVIAHELVVRASTGG
ncbi:MAG: LacI family DNA-binding transcriptional regulator [Micrococcales bacterium]|nr:LacI family DNA-binding transcriptional regulator [Micrococcales bacterium]